MRANIFCPTTFVLEEYVHFIGFSGAANNSVYTFLVCKSEENPGVFFSFIQV